MARYFLQEYQWTVAERRSERRMSMGEAKRRKEVVEDLGKRIFRCPDLCGANLRGLAEETGHPANDPRIISSSENASGAMLWVVADGKECGV
jgi:hypothetical protein